MGYKVLVGMMSISVALAFVPGVGAHAAVPGGAVAGCSLPAGTLTCDVPGGCSLGTTKAVHVHPGGSGLGSIALDCAFGGISFNAVSCTSTQVCDLASANAIGGNLRCTKATAGSDGYCAIFP